MRLSGLLTVAVAAAARGSTAPEKMNALLIAVDDLRPLFGRAFGVVEVLTPHLDGFFVDGGGSAMQHSYVQVAVCGPSRASILTGRRPDSTQVGMQPTLNDWCWCQRSNCSDDALFMTTPTYLAKHGFLTAGVGKIFHPDGCTYMKKPYGFGPQFSHQVGDDYRAWNHGRYGVEGRATTTTPPLPTKYEQVSQEQYGSIPGPYYPVFDGQMGDSWQISPLTDEEQPDGMIATNAVERFANFSRDGIGKAGGKRFFHAVGFHKPHLPHIVPQKYYDMYELGSISLPPNPNVPVGMKAENWRYDGNVEMGGYGNNPAFQNTSEFGFEKPLPDQKQRELRRGYFAATSFLDAQAGRVLDALTENGFKDNTVVVLWSDHGWHLGDTNSWCKMTNFETGTRNTLFWRVPGQTASSQGRNRRMVEMVDFFPTLVDLLGLPALPACQGLDQPPTVDCLQGASYASEFLPERFAAAEPKSNAFSQWPFPAAFSAPISFFRVGYTVRTVDGFRLTEYVPYADNKGNWDDSAGTHDVELYDYSVDPHESINLAANTSYSATVQRLKTVLRRQYTAGQS